MHVGVTNLHAQAPPTLITTSSHTRALLWLFNEYSDDVARARLYYNDFAEPKHACSREPSIPTPYYIGEVYGTLRSPRRYRLVRQIA